MTSAVDTNVLVALLAGTEAETEAAGRALSEAAASGAVLVCGAVYAELLATPGLTAAELDVFLAETDLEVVWSLDKAVWQAAGQAYGGYAGRRRPPPGCSPSTRSSTARTSGRSSSSFPRPGVARRLEAKKLPEVVPGHKR